MMNNEHNIQYFTQIPSWMDELTDVSDFQVRLMGYVYTFENITGVAFPSNTTLANHFHKSKITIKRALSDLYIKKYITSQKIYKENSKEIEKRILHVVKPNNLKLNKNEPTPRLNNDTEVVSKNNPRGYQIDTSSILLNKSFNKLKEKEKISQQSKLNSTKDISNNKDINSTKKINELKKNKKNEAKEILGYLNKVTDKHFRDINSNISLLTTLLSSYQSKDIERVIDFKFKHWRNTEMSKYLRPSTLFRSSNFDRYVNELPKEKVAPKEKVQPQTKETGFGSELGFLRGDKND